MNPEDVTAEQADRISVIWFGSLALIAALAGPLTAMVSLGLQRIGEHKPVPSKLSTLLRIWLLRWRFRRTRRVEVTKEVFVDRPVDKIVEVPVERIVQNSCMSRC